MALENRLASIPFGHLIGAPLNAAIEAQARAAMTTVDFIKAVGLDENEKVKYITFKMKQVVPEVPRVDEVIGTGTAAKPQVPAEPAKPATTKDVSIEVPLLTIVPIPFIRIDDMNIAFKASLTESGESSNEVKTGVAATVTGKGSYNTFFTKYEMSATVSSKRDSTSTRSSKYSVEYNMDINVHAVQDDMPAGMAAILGALTSNLENQVK